MKLNPDHILRPSVEEIVRWWPFEVLVIKVEIVRLAEIIPRIVEMCNCEAKFYETATLLKHCSFRKG